MSSANSPALDDLLRRICAEYTEMPGLRVTHPQAQRLRGLDAPTCRQVLDALVDVKFLTVTASGQYMRMADGTPATPAPRMLKAALERHAMKPAFADAARRRR